MQQTKKFNVVIVGQGAIGLLYYSFFYKNEAIQVRLLRSKRSNNSVSNAVTHNKGVIVKISATPDESPEKIPVEHASNTDINDADAIILCVKSYQVPQAIRDILPHLSPSTSILLCHNGMGTFETLSLEIKNQHNVLAMLTTHGCKKSDVTSIPKGSVNVPSAYEYAIEHTGLGRTDLGSLSVTKSFTNSVKEKLVTLFTETLDDFSWQENIAQQQWTKLAINCVINPITALNSIKNGGVLSPTFKPLINNILNEVVQVAKAENIELDAVQLLKTVLTVADKTANNSSSMYCDVQEKRATEIDYINGYIHRLGEKHHIKTVENTRLWQQVNVLNKS